MTPEEVKVKLLKNPWFLWILVILGINPLYFVGPVLNSSAQHLDEVSRDVMMSNSNRF